MNSPVSIVTQADREAAAALAGTDGQFGSPPPLLSLGYRVGILAGKADDGRFVQAFARHREEAVREADDFVEVLEELLSATEEVGYVHYGPIRRKARAILSRYRKSDEGEDGRPSATCSCPSGQAPTGLDASRFDQAQGWQPIETAPRDGTHILVWGECDGEINGRFGQSECVVASLMANGSAFSDSSDAYTVQVHATHWMPLPEAPAVQS